MDDRPGESTLRRGPIAAMASRTVAANLLMLALIIGGLIMAPRLQQEVFPDVDLDLVIVNVTYPGAGPEEVEEGVVLAIEEAMRDIDDVEEIRSTAREGSAQVIAEIRSDANAQRALDDIKSEVDRIESFPEDAERPVVFLATSRDEVVSLIIHGDVSPKALDNAAERAREELLQDDRITQVEITGLPPPEISIEVPRENLRRYGLTLPEIARRVEQASVDVPAGGVETRGGEILLRVVEKKEWAETYRDVVVLTREDGSRITLGMIGEVIDGFRDTDVEAYYDGERAVRLRVFRVGDQTPIEVSEAVRDYVDRVEEELPASLAVAMWNDTAEIFNDRINLLLRNGALGAVLVIVVLGIFLRLRVAFWVTIGLPVSFLGAFLFMQALGVSINMISLFAFILALGIVVDDAIVVGEAVHKHREEGETPLQAAVSGAREMIGPIVFAVLTTITAFLPLLFVPGIIGDFFDPIPLTVIPILLLSLVESFFILPAHLAHSREVERSGLLARVAAAQERFSRLVQRLIDERYRPALRAALRRRYVTLAGALALLLLCAGLVAGNRVKFRFLPQIEGDLVSAQVRLPFGAPEEETRQAMRQLTQSAREVLGEAGEPARGVYAQLGELGAADTGPGEQDTDAGGHLAEVAVFLAPAGERELSSESFARRWREEVGEIPGVEALDFEYSAGPPAGAAVAIELSHPELPTLRAAAEALAGELATYDGVVDVDSGFQRGKPQLDLTLEPGARALGVTEEDLGRQIRGAFFGAEALRQQRGRHELRVYVRLPEEQRRSAADALGYIIRTPGGGEIPLQQAARIRYGRSSTDINREGGRRVVEVTADVDPRVTTGGEVTDDALEEIVPRLEERFPGLRHERAGEQEERQESLDALGAGMMLALLAMYVLMAVAFGSYVQPFLILLAIPFGLIGALGGHLLLGFDLSIISLLGMVALSGVVVNDSLVLIAAVNDRRAAGASTEDALADGAARRFRPILLTSLTTFFGLSPMIFETSLQARFLVPMAASLGFGVLFVTVIALLIVPCAYLALEDARRGLSHLRERDRSSA